MDALNLFDFIPAPVRGRRDGWTPDRQRRFIALLAAGTPSNHAAKAVGMSKQTAHALRRRPGAESFAAAWEAALTQARKDRYMPQIGRVEAAIDGTLRPIMYHGRLVGHERRFDNRLLRRLIGMAERTEARAAARRAEANLAFPAPRPGLPRGR